MAAPSTVPRLVEETKDCQDAKRGDLHEGTELHSRGAIWCRIFLVLTVSSCSLLQLIIENILELGMDIDATYSSMRTR